MKRSEDGYIHDPNNGLYNLYNNEPQLLFCSDPLTYITIYDDQMTHSILNCQESELSHALPF